jgi:hypothetical protein
MLGVIRLTLDDDCESMRGDDDFFSVARTMPLVAGVACQRYSLRCSCCQDVPLIPSEVTPWLTAFRAYSTPELDLLDSTRMQSAERTYLYELSAMQVSRWI